MKYLTLLFTGLTLVACAIPNPAYTLTAYTAKGKILGKKVELSSNKAGIPMMRDTLCKTYPKAIIHVRDKNGNEATEYSPYACR
ncbi:hypothetical protein [Neisseria wadsworthii]|uniref:hypothetical protein n=1 Tax=Neisseria wadsworthii TaxID=607711 RepID=UPI000D319745|nr:hypothetical protein [Neisseria wadsworthii]